MQTDLLEWVGTVSIAGLSMIYYGKWLGGYILAVIFCAGLITGCTEMHRNQQDSRKTTRRSADTRRVPVSYHIQPVKDSASRFLRRHYDLEQQAIILALNRIDREHVSLLDSLIIPDTLLSDLMQYSPFPFVVPSLEEVRKIIFFSYPAQAFGAYEYGRLLHWGPTSMGRQDAQTPEGVYYATWKAVETQSTVDDEWILRWNFNIENKEGIGWHQYAMPGYPASHSCLRLLEQDARFLYDWGEQWMLNESDQILAHGTPAVVFGQYPFGQTKPWYALAQNPRALDISEKQLELSLRGKVNEVLRYQQQLDSVRQAKQGAVVTTR